MPHSWEKDARGWKAEFPGNYGEDTLTKPGKALPGIPGIPIYLQDVGIIQVLPEQFLGSEQSKNFQEGKKKFGMNWELQSREMGTKGENSRVLWWLEMLRRTEITQSPSGCRKSTWNDRRCRDEIPPNAGKDCRSLTHLLLVQEEH